jgi:hypothetical protein
MHSSWSLLSLAVSAASAAPSLSRRAPAGAPIVNLKNGSYYGVHNSQYNQDFFLGIPFAQPPVDELRFANPESVNTTWTGALPATNYDFVSLHTLLGDTIMLIHDARSALVTEVIRSATNKLRTACTSTLLDHPATRTSACH